MKKRLLCIFIFCFIASCSIGFGSYIIENLQINGADNDVEIGFAEDKTNYKKVTFLDENGDNIGTRYIREGEKLYIDKFPENYQSPKYEWLDSSNNGVFTLHDSSFSEGLVISDDITLKANNIIESATQTIPTSNNFKITSGSETNIIGVGNGKFNINEGSNKGNEIELVNLPVLKDVDADLNFKTTDSDGNVSDNQNIHQDLGDNNSTQFGDDVTIGLEDPYSTSDIYKPKAGSTSNNVNPLVTRLKLSCDTYLVGQSWLGIGARTGFYNGGWGSQFNYQGFINGSYCELDLNGNYLYIGDGATLELYGSLINSNPKKGGIIVENGGTVKSTFTIEDHYHETSIPIAYLYGDAPFKMYRMPYLNAEMKLEKGSKLIGYFMIDFGGDNANYLNTELKIVGDTSEYMINTSKCHNNSYITRTPLWDSYWYPNDENKDSINTETETINSIVYEQFEYRFYDCNNLEINNPQFGDIPYKVALSKVTFKINWDRCDLFIPPYFKFYLYNSSAKIKNNIVFLPGSYLFVDENSSIILSAGNFGYAGKLLDVSIFLEALVWSLIPDKFKINPAFQSVGGLMFLSEKYNWQESFDGWAGNNNDDSNPAIIFKNTTQFWSYLSKNKPAKADIYGEIIFDQSATLVKENYHLGGEINLYNLSSFADNFNASVELYNSIFIGQLQHFVDGKTYYFNADSFSVLPLISEGNVLTDMNDLDLRSDFASAKYVFDKDTGLITANNGIKYAYTYCDNAGLYNNRSNNLNKSQYDEGKYSQSDYQSTNDDLRAKFYRVQSINEDGSVNLSVPMYANDTNIYSFIYFRGSFFRFSSGKVDIFKFKGPNPSSNNKGWSNDYALSVSYIANDSYYGHGAWRLS